MVLLSGQTDHDYNPKSYQIHAVCDSDLKSCMHTGQAAWVLLSDAVDSIVLQRIYGDTLGSESLNLVI